MPHRRLLPCPFGVRAELADLAGACHSDYPATVNLDAGRGRSDEIGAIVTGCSREMDLELAPLVLNVLHVVGLRSPGGK